MLRNVLLPLLLVFAVMTAASAGAETLRVPQTGTASFTLDVPAGWTASYDDHGTLQLLANDNSAQVQLSIITVNAGMTAAELALAIKPPEVTTPYGRPVAAKIGGLTGQEFTLTVGEGVEMSLVLVQLNDTTFAAQTALRRTASSPAQLAALKALLGLIKLAK